MNLVPAKTPLAVRKLFPNYIWNVATKDRILYLTFDDGPTPEVTDWTLDTLKEYNAKATFFCIGDNVEKHPDIFKRIIKEGHSIGNHTHNHLKGWKTTTQDYIENVDQAESLIKVQNPKSRLDTFKSQKKLFRPPYGRITPSQAKSIIQRNYKIVMWSVLSFDWDKDVSHPDCLQNVTSNAKQGDIVVFHDSFKAKENLMASLPKVLEHYQSRGYSFENLDILLDDSN